MKILIVTPEPVDATLLRDALDGEDPSQTEVLVTSPALASSPLRFWMSDVDEAIARAEAIQEQSVQRLERAGVDARGDTGESDPVQAIEDALKTFDADRIIVFIHPESERRHREDELAADLEKRFSLPVAHRFIMG
jgi:nucleotide-binding universal stress UspA family protein